MNGEGMRDIHLSLQPRTQSLHACPEMSPQDSPGGHPAPTPHPCPPRPRPTPAQPPPGPHCHADRRAADAAAQSFRGHAPERQLRQPLPVVALWALYTQPAGTAPPKGLLSSCLAQPLCSRVPGVGLPGQGVTEVWTLHLLFIKTESASRVQLCDTMDGSLPGFFVQGILQARRLGWGAAPFSRAIFPTQGSNPSCLFIKRGPD